QGGTVPTTPFNITIAAPIIGNISALEGISGLTPFVFKVSLLAAPRQPVQFDVFTTDGTAVSTGAKPSFVPILPGVTSPNAVGIPTFAPGQIPQTVTVYVIAGSIPAAAGSKAFTVSLSNPASPYTPLVTATGNIIPQGGTGGSGTIVKPRIANISQLEG